MYCGVRFGLSLGDELVDLLEYDEPGLAMIMLDHGLLFVVVGVVLLLVHDDTDEGDGDEARLLYHV